MIPFTEASCSDRSNERKRILDGMVVVTVEPVCVGLGKGRIELSMRSFPEGHIYVCRWVNPSDPHLPLLLPPFLYEMIIFSLGDFSDSNSNKALVIRP